MKKLGLVLILFSMLYLTGCDNIIITAEDKELEQYQEKYLVETPIPEVSISNYTMKLNFRARMIDELETYQNLEKIQNWLDNCNNIEVVEMIPIENIKGSGISGIDFVIKNSTDEHDYKIVVCQSTSNIKNYVSAVKLSKAEGYEGYNIVLIDNAKNRTNSSLMVDVSEKVEEGISKSLEENME